MGMMGGMGGMGMMGMMMMNPQMMQFQMTSMMMQQMTQMVMSNVESVGMIGSLLVQILGGTGYGLQRFVESLKPFPKEGWPMGHPRCGKHMHHRKIIYYFCPHVELIY